MPALEELLLSLFATTNIYKHLHQSSWIFVLYLLHFPFFAHAKRGSNATAAADGSTVPAILASGNSPYCTLI